MKRGRRAAASVASLVAAGGVTLLPTQVVNAEVGDDKLGKDHWVVSYTWGGESYSCVIDVEATLRDNRGHGRIASVLGTPDQSFCDGAELAVSFTYRDVHGHAARSHAVGYGHLVSLTEDDVKDNFVVSFSAGLFCNEEIDGVCTTRRTVIPK